MTEPTNVAPLPRTKKPGESLKVQDPAHIIYVARMVSGKGGTLEDAVTTLKKYFAGYDIADKRWFAARLTYYRRNSEFKPLLANVKFASPVKQKAEPRSVIGRLAELEAALETPPEPVTTEADAALAAVAAEVRMAEAAEGGKGKKGR